MKSMNYVSLDYAFPSIRKHLQENHLYGHVLCLVIDDAGNPVVGIGADTIKAADDAEAQLAKPKTGE